MGREGKGRDEFDDWTLDCGRVSIGLHRLTDQVGESGRMK